MCHLRHSYMCVSTWWSLPVQNMSECTRCTADVWCVLYRNIFIIYELFICNNMYLCILIHTYNRFDATILWATWAFSCIHIHIYNTHYLPLIEAKPIAIRRPTSEKKHQVADFWVWFRSCLAESLCFILFCQTLPGFIIVITSYDYFHSVYGYFPLTTLVILCV